MAVITLGSALGNMFGSILSGALLDLQGTLGLAGWQWVFIATGVPAMLLTGAVLKWLPNSPHDARFLTGAEKEWIASTVRSEGSPPERRGLAVLWDARVLFFATVYALIMISLDGVIYWLPTVVHSFGVTGSQNGLLNAIPWATAAIALSSLPELRRREEDVVSRMSVLALVGLVSFFASTMVSSNWARLVAVSIGTPCISLLMPCFWSLPARRWSGPRGAAAGDRRDQQRRQPWRIPGTESHAVGGSRCGEQRCPHGRPCDLFDRARNRRLGRAPVLKETGPRSSVSCGARPLQRPLPEEGGQRGPIELLIQLRTRAGQFPERSPIQFVDRRRLIGIGEVHAKRVKLYSWPRLNPEGHGNASCAHASVPTPT
jgi:Major Facilitator Superfamily